VGHVLDRLRGHPGAARHRRDVHSLHGGAERAGIHAGRGQPLLEDDLEHGRAPAPPRCPAHCAATRRRGRRHGQPRLHVHIGAGTARGERMHLHEVRCVRGGAQPGLEEIRPERDEVAGFPRCRRWGMASRRSSRDWRRAAAPAPAARRPGGDARPAPSPTRRGGARGCGLEPGDHGDLLPRPARASAPSLSASSFSAVSHGAVFPSTMAPRNRRDDTAPATPSGRGCTARPR
jgi:hypothetical protein